MTADPYIARRVRDCQVKVRGCPAGDGWLHVPPGLAFSLLALLDEAVVPADPMEALRDATAEVESIYPDGHASMSVRGLVAAARAVLASGDTPRPKVGDRVQVKDGHKATVKALDVVALVESDNGWRWWLNADSLTVLPPVDQPDEEGQP